MSTFAWDDLRHFLAFARAGSMQAAATALGVNQSTVQRRIAELEECVGHHLVERHLGSYRMTELGEQLLPAAEAVEAAVAAFERHLAASERKGSHRYRSPDLRIWPGECSSTDATDRCLSCTLSWTAGRIGDQRPLS